MREINLFSLFVSKLEDAGILYAVTGSSASTIYGEPRLTNDIDIVVDLKKEHVKQLPMLFNENDFYLPPEEVILLEMSRSLRGHFNIIDHESGFKADIYLVGNDELQKWAIENAFVTQLDGLNVRIAPPEYVIIKKLQFHREGGSEKHINDILGMLRGDDVDIDLEQFNDRIQSLGLDTEWQKVLTQLNRR